MKKRIIAFTSAFLLLTNTLAFAGINKHPVIDEMIVNKEHDKINEFIRKDTRNQIERTVSTMVEIDENNILGPAYKEILGHGTEAFNTMDENCLDANGDVSEEYQKLCDEEFYDAPCARIGGGAINGYSMLGQIGPAANRKVATWLLSEEDTKLFHPEAVHSCSYGSQAAVRTCGTVEWIKAMQAQNPDIAFIFCVSVTHDTNENIINFARFCLDDPSESHWGQLRQDYGLDKLNVLAFEAGNEIYINNTKYDKQWFADRVSWYAKRFNNLYDELSQVFPDLPLAPSFAGDYNEDDPNDPYDRFRERWTRPLLEQIGKDRLKYLGFHLYYGGYEPAYCCKAYDYIDEILTDLFGENHGIQLLVTEHAKWMAGTQWTTAATLESALTTAQYLNYLYALPHQFVRAANYYAFTTVNHWALMRRCYDDTLVVSGVGKMYDLYLKKLGDRVVSTNSIPQDDSGLCDKSLTFARFSAQAFAKDKNKLTVMLTNREEHTAVDIQFNFLKNKYKLVEETVFTAPHTLSFVYDKGSKDNIFSTVSTKKNESNFSHYVMPNHSMVVLELEAIGGTIPQWGESVDSTEGVITYEGEPHFTDTKHHWADAEINLLAEEKLVSGNGDGTFAPDAKISKAEFSAMLCKLMGTDTISVSALTDVSSADWYYNYANTIVNRGYLSLTDGIFNPQGEIALKDALTILYRVCSTRKNDTKVENADEIVKGIGVNASLTDWEKDAMAYLCKNNFITEFYEVTDIGLSSGITRAEAAALIYRLKSHLGITVEVETEEV